MKFLDAALRTKTLQALGGISMGARSFLQRALPALALSFSMLGASAAPAGDIEGYDAPGMTHLFEVTAAGPALRGLQTADPHADIVTGSLAPVTPPARPSGRVGSYYAQLGSYGTIDGASRRYFEILNRDPDLQGNERVSIESAQSDNALVHRVRMGLFSTEAAALAACARTGLPADECRVGRAH